MARKTKDTIKWETLLLERVKGCHKRNLNKTVSRLMRKISTAKSSLTTRSKKYNVECKMTLNELRQMVYEYYGTPCKYCGRLLTINNLVFDHTIPISRGGNSNVDNIQIVCRACNGVKGALIESNFQLLLDWLKTVPDELATDIRVRLARGVH